MDSSDFWDAQKEHDTNKRIGINYEQTWETILEKRENILVFSIDAHLEKRGKKLFDILLASLYN